MRYEDMTKAQLLKVAKDYEIVGRHDMAKDALVEALNEAAEAEAEDDELDESLAEPRFISKAQLVEKKRRLPSRAIRGDDGKVVRRGKNLSGNVPYMQKFYSLNPALADEAKWPDSYKEAVAAAPKQVQQILRFMREAQLVGENAERGPEIAGEAINHGYVTSKIKPANLFAYYRRLLEALGVEHVTDFGEE